MLVGGRLHVDVSRSALYPPNQRRATRKVKPSSLIQGSSLFAVSSATTRKLGAQALQESGRGGGARRCLVVMLPSAAKSHKLGTLPLQPFHSFHRRHKNCSHKPGKQLQPPYPLRAAASAQQSPKSSWQRAKKTKEYEQNLLGSRILQITCVGGKPEQHSRRAIWRMSPWTHPASTS